MNDKDALCLSYSQKVALLESLTNIKQILPANMDLTPEQRRAISSMGESRAKSIERLIKTWKTDGSEFPGEVEIEELEMLYLDTLLYKELLMELDKVRLKINDLYLQQGCETIKLSTTVKRKIEGFQSIYGGMEKYISVL